MDDECFVFAWSGIQRPEMRQLPFYFDGEGDYVEFSTAQFESLFGFLPPTDAPIRVEFSARQVP